MAPRDLTGGLDPAVDEVTAVPPVSPAYREGVSLWIWDDAGRFGLPRVGVEAVGARWQESFGTALCLARPDGRLSLVSGDHRPDPVRDADGRPRVLGAGPLQFRCVEPFDRWVVTFDGGVVTTDWRRHVDGGLPQLRIGAGHDETHLRLHVEARMIAPPWSQGTYEPEGHFVPGEQRFEQLCAVTGELEVDGVTTPFAGGGLRVHRKGGNRSDYRDFYGHNWQSTWFPSGRAFGFLHYRPRPDGSVKYREGWVLDDGQIVPAWVEGTPWMTAATPSGEDVSFTLRTARGDIAIEGETLTSSFRPPRPVGDGATFPLLHSGIARYRWGDEVTYGMIERSARLPGYE